MCESKYPEISYRKTLSSLKASEPLSTKILDLSVINPFSEILQQEGYQVGNTKGVDLDLDHSSVQNTDADLSMTLNI